MVVEGGPKISVAMVPWPAVNWVWASASSVVLALTTPRVQSVTAAPNWASAPCHSTSAALSGMAGSFLAVAATVSPNETQGGVTCAE